MGFKEWFLSESGHMKVQGISFETLYHGRYTLFEDVYWIDPRFEHQHVSPPDSVTMVKNGQIFTKPYPFEKFMGDQEYSLPIKKGYIVSQRESVINGAGVIKYKPSGIICPKDWADYAIIIDRSGMQTYGADVRPTFAEPYVRQRSRS